MRTVNRIVRPLWLLSILALALTAFCLADINVNIDVSNRTGLVGPAGGAGKVWNERLKVAGLTASNLLDASGSTTSIGFTLDAGFVDPWGAPSLVLLTSAAFQWNWNTPAHLIVTGLDANKRYDLHLASFYPNETGSRTLFSTSNATTITGIQIVDTGGPNGNNSTWVQGMNFACFRSIQPSSNGSIGVTMVGDGGKRAFLSGFQLVDVRCFVDITNESAIVPWEEATFTVGGTNGAATGATNRVVGSMWWTNECGTGVSPVSGTLPATNSWTIPSIPLALGANKIIVCGSNAFGLIGSDSIVISRSMPSLLDITNSDTTVLIGVTNCVVGGTNTSGFVGHMWVSNASMGGAALAFARSGFSFTTPPVPVRTGANVIRVYGSNAADFISSDSVTITMFPAPAEAVIGHWISGEQDLADMSGFTPVGTHDGIAEGANAGLLAFSTNVPSGFGGYSLDLTAGGAGDVGVRINNTRVSDPGYTNTFDDPILSRFSVAFWAKGFPVGNIWDPWVAKHGYDSTGWQVRRYWGTPWPTFSIPGISDDPVAVVNTDNNNWHHYVGVFDGVVGIQSLYVDGVDYLMDIGLFGTVGNARHYSLELGAREGANYFKGLLYDVRIYSIPLSSSQVHTIMTTPPPPSPPRAKILRFGLQSTPAIIAETNITWALPYGMPATNLAPTYTLSSGATCDKASGSAHDFSLPVAYTVTSSDSKITNVYTVTIGDFHYVNQANIASAYPYTSWATAATNIQVAVDAAAVGETVLVTNGIYATGARVTPGYACSNRVVIVKNIVVRSVNGPTATIIKGQGPRGSGAVRCVYMSTGTLCGFALTNGHTMTSGYEDYVMDGGGVNMHGGDGIVTNCIISGNRANHGGGIEGGTANNCIISGNQAVWGGGIELVTANNCTISGNNAYYGGGTVYSTVNNCMIIGNSATYGGGMTHDFHPAHNCMIISNSADYGGGAFYTTLNNCTISGNSAAYGGGVCGTLVQNSIVWGNTATIASNNIGGDMPATYTCTAPLFPGEGNISSDPLFVDAAAGNYRLQDASPCINAGSTGQVVLGQVDLDGLPRVMDGIVDMGAHEKPGVYMDTLSLDFSLDTRMENSIALTNYRGDALAYNVVESMPWLSVEPLSGSLGTNSMTHTFSADQTGMAKAIHEGDATFAFAGGRSATTTVRCRLIATNAVKADAGGPYLSTPGAEVLLDATGSRGWKLSYSWQVGTGTATAFSASHAWHTIVAGSVPGTSTVTVVARDTRVPPQYGTNTTLLIVLNNGPSIEIGGPYTGQVGHAVTFRAVAGNGATTVRWDFGFGWTAWQGLSATNTSFTYASPGVFAVQCQALDGYGLTNADATAAMIDEANAPPVAVATLGAGGATETNLAGMTVGVTLDASASHDDYTATTNQVFDWREDPANPRTPLLSDAARQQMQVAIGAFPYPGAYRFHLVVNDGGLNSQPATVQVNVPGIAGMVKTEGLDRMVPLYGVNVIVTNHATGRVTSDNRTDFDGRFVADTGSGGGRLVTLDRNGVAAVRSVTVDADGDAAVLLTYSPRWCQFSALAYSDYWNQVYAAVPLAQASLVIGNEGVLNSQGDLSGEIPFGGIPEIWPESAVVTYKLLCQKPGYRSQVTDVTPHYDATARPTVPMESASACTVQGMVIASNGTPVGGATVDFGPVYGFATTGVDGRFALNGVCRGSYYLRVRATGYQSTWQRVDVPNGDTNVVLATPLQLRGGVCRVYGEVVAANNPAQPLPGAQVMVVRAGAATNMMPVTALGYFDVAVLRGAQQVRVEAPGYEPATIPLDVQDHTRLTVLLVVPEPVAIGAILCAGALVRLYVRRKGHGHLAKAAVRRTESCPRVSESETLA